MINLNNKIIIVTGAGGAIGSAATRQFTSFGANVLAVDIDDTSITNTFADNDSVLPVQSDVTEPDGILATVSAAKDRWGRIDGLFSNAGTEGALSRIVDYPVDLFDRLVKLNIRAVFLGLKFVLPELQTGGAIVNMSSANMMHLLRLTLFDSDESQLRWQDLERVEEALIIRNNWQ